MARLPPSMQTGELCEESRQMDPVLAVKNLKVGFRSDFGNSVVTDSISFSVQPGETLCIVGESGCGKSVTSLAIMGLLASNGFIDDGEVLFEGTDLVKLSQKELDAIRGKDLAMIYQDALASLNPVFTIGTQMTEPLRIHLGMKRKDAYARSVELLKLSGLSDADAVMKKYPHELSGGQRQRAMIAMALACSPKLLIADEPTTALDVTIQAQIMQRIRKIRGEMDMAMILITHDIGLVAQMADRVLVMYAGQIIEEAEVGELFAHPKHPYTRALLACAPDIYDSEERVLASIRGTVPEAYWQIEGCRFAGRCDYACEACHAAQQMRTADDGAEGTSPHYVRCARV